LYSSPAPFAETGQDRSANAPGTFLVNQRTYGVLVVDDEELLRGLLSIGLRQHCFAVWVAADGDEALELYWQHRESIHVVLLDVRMPGRDGPQTLSALKEVQPRIRVCFMSGDLGGYTEEGLLDLGAATVIRKPFHLAEVARVLVGLASEGNVCPSRG
jgi:DNA-binding response OmpR family regulator